MPRIWRFVRVPKPSFRPSKKAFSKNNYSSKKSFLYLYPMTDYIASVKRFITGSLVVFNRWGAGIAALHIFQFELLDELFFGKLLLSLFQITLCIFHDVSFEG